MTAASRTSPVGFVVIYHWRLKPDRERDFCQVWERVTQRLMSTHGALGSRLHQAEDGSWMAYAQWPTRDAWERAPALGTLDADAERVMRDAIAERFPPILLRLVADLWAVGSTTGAVAD